MKHLLNFHDGEVRFVGDPWWADVTDPAFGGRLPNLHLPAFWHPQTMRTKQAKEWCFWRHGAGQKVQWTKQQPLTTEEIAWIMRVEGGETRLMRQVPPRASGGWSTPARWQIRQGNMITLAELFSFGAYRCTCWDLYRTYRSLEVFIDPQPRVRSGSENANFRDNAKRKRRMDTGR